MSDLNAPCEHCGAPVGEIAFVRYQADPNDAQTECEWFEDVADRMYSIVCTGCGLGKAAIDPRQEEDLPDFDDLPDGTGASDFKVDEELK